MKKLLNNPWVVATLAVFALGFVAWSLREHIGGGQFAAPMASVLGVGDEAAPDDESTAGDDPVDGVRSIPMTLAALVLPTNLPDPFLRRGPTMVAGDPEVVAGPTVPDQVESIRLTAVWNQGGSAFAVINGQIMRPGDVVGRLTIDTIAPDGVWVTHWKGRNFVSFGGEFTLVTPAAGPAGRSLFTP